MLRLSRGNIEGCRAIAVLLPGDQSCLLGHLTLCSQVSKAVVDLGSALTEGDALIRQVVVLAELHDLAAHRIEGVTWHHWEPGWVWEQGYFRLTI